VLQERVMAFALLGSEWVLWLLVGLSVLCAAAAVGRGLRAVTDRDQGGELDQALTSFAHDHDVHAFQTRLGKIRGPEARVLSAGLEAAEERGAESASEVLAAALATERNQLDRGLPILATTGSNAPFIGLFGTVLGIIRAFHDLSLDDAGAASSVMAGISEALVATAIGLLVAIPAVVLYNLFQRLNQQTLRRMESRSRILLSRYKGSPQKAGA
jgi:biopolymer transport protein ExbB